MLVFLLRCRYFCKMVSMKTNHKNLISFSLAALLAGGLAVYIYTDLRKSSASSPPENQQPKQSPISLEATDPNRAYSIEVIPDKPAALVSKIPRMPNLGLPVTDYGHLDEAAFKIASQNIADASQKLKKDSKDELLWLKLGIYRKMVSDYQTAVEILNYVAALWPNDYTPYNNLADLYQYYIKNYPLAEKNWLKVIEIKPDYTSAYENLHDLYLYSYTEKKAQTLPILIKGLTNNPKSIDLMLYTAREYRARGDNAQATIYYNKAIDEARAEHNEQAEASLQAEASGQ